MNPPENPESVQPAIPDFEPPPSEARSLESAVSAGRDPVWTGWDVLALVVFGLVALLSLTLAAIAMLPGVTFQQKIRTLVATPEVALAVQVVAELLVIACMYVIVLSRSRGAKFWQSVHWKWPTNFGWYLLIGVMMQAVFLLVARFLPFPRETPLQEILKRPYSMLIILVFSITLGPLFEELFFRGFLFSVLRRSFGPLVAIVGTAVPFGLVHASQYGYSWASVLLICMVGLVLATVREKKDSLAASFLVHVAYNSVIVLALGLGTDGFRHLEKLNQ